MRTRPSPAFAALVLVAALAWVLRAPAQTTETPPSAEPPAGPPAAPTPPAPAAASAPAVAVVPRSGEVLLNFQAADLQAVVKAVSQMTGRNILIDPRVRGQVTIVSARPMPVAGAYQVFLSALKAQGFTAVEGPGDTVRIVPVAEAKASAPVNDREGPPSGGEQIVTHVVIGQHVAVSQLQNVLRPLMSPTSQLSVYDPANALVITDYADNVRRLLRIIERIDQPAGTEVTVVPLENASALDVAELVVRLSGTGLATPGGVPGAPTQVAAGGDRFSVVPDTRTNSLLLRSDNPGRIAQLRALIAKLDVPARAIGSTRVIYLKHAEAPKLVEVLRGLLGAAAAGAPGAAPGAARPGGATQSLIQADEATNSIVINASDTVYNNLRAVVEQLDVRRAQVYVESLIAEMNADRTDELGIQWATAGQVGSSTVGAAANFPGARPSLAAAAAAPAAAALSTAGLAVAVLGNKITLKDGTTVTSLGALARALESKSLGNILSTPTLLTLDNYQAKIIIGQNVPFITGSFATPAAGATTAGAVNPFQTIERKDVGLTLRIKPQISEGSTIRMEIYQEVSDIASSLGTGASDIITNKRALETKVIVDDGNTIVLGGLIQNNLTETMQAIPLLGDIPFIGALFRFKSSERKRTNLMVFLRPVIIRTVEDGYRVTIDRYEYLRGYTRGEGPEREEIYDRMRPVVPGPSREPPARGPGQDSPALPPKQPDAGAAPAPARP
ncbi:MAG TPA: type II secretion system secretin GspD [Burkholderiales bacterium]